jgi:hypothetical protein
MRILSPNADRELELQIVQETSQQLTLQRGLLSRSAAIEKGWLSLLRVIRPICLFTLIFLYLMYKNGTFDATMSKPTGMYHLLMSTGVMSAGLLLLLPIAVILYELLKSYSIVWTFNRLERVLEKSRMNLLNYHRIDKHPFDEIDFIGVEQNEDSDNEYVKCCELYLAFHSGKQITLSQSCYTFDRRAQAIALQQHREIAEKMRSFLGHNTPDTERADRVRIPTVREVESENNVDWDTVKGAMSVLFGSREHRQSEIDNLQEKLITDRENPQLWEALSLQLAMNKEKYRESIEALSHAESIYRDRGDETKANELAKKIALFKAKI